MKHFFLIAAFFLFPELPGFGQQLLVGCFTTENSAGQPDSVFCVGDTVFAVNCFPNPNPTTTVYDFGTGLGDSPLNYFVYTTPGVYSIRQRGTSTVGNSYELIKTNYLTVVALPNPQFTATACNNNQVFFEITDLTYDSYSVAFGDGATNVVAPGASLVHAYALSGTYTITVTGTDNESGCTGSSSFTVTTLTSLPQADLQKVEVLNAPFVNGSTRLSFTTVAGYKYGIYFRPLSGAFQLAGTFTATNTGLSAFTHTPVNNVQQGCYRIETMDACNSASLPVSGELCTVTLTAAPQNGQNQIVWQAYPTATVPAFQEYQLYRNGSVLVTLPVGTTTYTDQAVSCGKNYCYQVQAIMANAEISVSNASCAVAISTEVPETGVAYSGFSLQNTINLTVLPPANAPVSKIIAFRSVNGNPFTPIGFSNGNLFTDTDTSALYTTYCYQAAYADSCGNQSDTSSITCPILLHGQLLNATATTQQIQLSWTPYVGFASGVQRYVVEILDENFAFIESIPAGSALTFTDNDLPGASAVLYYRIKGIPNSPAEPVTYSNYRKFLQEISFAIPNAFSPNGDNLNEIFEIKGGFFRQFDLTILSRTGQVVFQSSETRRTWDGTINGKPVPADVYVFQFRGVDSFGRPVSENGTITLLR